MISIMYVINKTINRPHVEIKKLSEYKCTRCGKKIEIYEPSWQYWHSTFTRKSYCRWCYDDVNACETKKRGK